MVKTGLMSPISHSDLPIPLDFSPARTTTTPMRATVTVVTKITSLSPGSELPMLSALGCLWTPLLTRVKSEQWAEEETPDRMPPRPIPRLQVVHQGPVAALRLSSPSLRRSLGLSSVPWMGVPSRDVRRRRNTLISQLARTSWRCERPTRLATPTQLLRSELG